MNLRRRPFRPIEIAIALALLGSVLSVAIPSFLRSLHSSRLAEPVAGLARIGAATLALAETHDGAFPISAPMTPDLPPRATVREDPPGTWDHPTWRALNFTPTDGQTPHAFSFGFENHGSVFVATSHGDLDGDGVLSTFEIRGANKQGVLALEPGMYVEDELE